MSDSLIDKYSKRPHSQLTEHMEPETDDLGCFGWLRGIRDRAVMLELRKGDGHVLAIGYSWMDQIEYVPEHGITLHMPSRKIRIAGSGLNTEIRPGMRLLTGLAAHRIPWLRESGRAAVFAEGRSISIETIRWDT